MAREEIFDGVIVVGAGLAGLSAAFGCAPKRALVLTPEPLLRACSSAWAQGGVAVALADEDSPLLHAEDTVAAGAGLVDPEMARILTAEGPATVLELAARGAPFDRDAEGRFVQSLEAAHSRARVARVQGDRAGRAIMEAVAAAALGDPRIEVRDNVRVRALLKDEAGRVRGVLASQSGRLTRILAPAVVLATGGLGGLFAVTTNPRGVRGEGLALAALAGARIADPEFVQFHPTALDVGADPAPLATEALRGEGARLVDSAGRAFMGRYHAQAELAPRDIVARAIHRQIAEGAGAFLDARQAVGARFPEEFPTVFAACMAAGVDPRVEPIPVAPAAHYHMGGVWTDANGRTSLPGLFAAGECASTGVHGANRLASNSLLEAAVFGGRAGRAAAAESDPSTPALPAAAPPDLPEPVLETLRQAMSRDVGVVRDREGLLRLLDLIANLDAEHGAALPLAAASTVALAALLRTESRGAHFRSDFPCMAAPARRTLTTLAELQSRGRTAQPRIAAE